MKITPATCIPVTRAVFTLHPQSDPWHKTALKIAAWISIVPTIFFTLAIDLYLYFHPRTVSVANSPQKDNVSHNIHHSNSHSMTRKHPAQPFWTTRNKITVAVLGIVVIAGLYLTYRWSSPSQQILSTTSIDNLNRCQPFATSKEVLNRRILQETEVASPSLELFDFVTPPKTTPNDMVTSSTGNVTHELFSTPSVDKRFPGALFKLTNSTSLDAVCTIVEPSFPSLTNLPYDIKSLYMTDNATPLKSPPSPSNDSLPIPTDIDTNTKVSSDYGWSLKRWGDCLRHRTCCLVTSNWWPTFLGGTSDAITAAKEIDADCAAACTETDDSLWCHRKSVISSH